jgi:dihydrolipoamide dehydrogenase
MDASISKTLQQILSKQGLEFHLGAKVTAAKVTEKQVTLHVEIGERKLDLIGDKVLVAVGRRAYSQGLELEKLGIITDRQGFIPVDQYFRTTKKNIYAIGDLISGPMLAHRASEEGIVVAEVIAGKNPSINYMTIPNIVYTMPEVASVGFTEKEAKDHQLDIVIGISYFKANGRARCIGITDGFVKIIAEKTSQRLVGMHIIGPFASELIAEGAVAISLKATLNELVYTSHAHPTLTETILEAVHQAKNKK